MDNTTLWMVFPLLGLAWIVLRDKSPRPRRRI